MDISLGFAKGSQSLTIPDDRVAGILHASPLPEGEKGPTLVAKALEAPIGAPRLKEIVRPGEKTVIVTSDITRPCPSHLIVPVLLDELEQNGCNLKDVTVVFAVGSHRKHTQEERRKLLGTSYDRVASVDADASDCVHLGVTSRGTPVDVFSLVANADKRICVGNIEYHYFAGYSGGAKAIMPGVSTRAAIQANHSRMVEDAARAGNLDGNPVREDIEEAIAFCPIHFIVNVVLDEEKNIVCAVAGDWIQAHRAGCRFLDGLYGVSIPAPADIVVTCPGGFPKDINLYQAQKALDNAKHAVRPGGIIILVGACTEGLGEGTFQRWMLNASSTGQLIRDIQDHFELGGHKAAAIAMVREKAEIFLVSELEPDFVRSLFMEPFASAQEAFDEAARRLGPQAKAYVMSHGGSVLPHVE